MSHAVRSLVKKRDFCSYADDVKGCEWSIGNGLSGLFAQKSNALNPYFSQMIREIVKFKHDVLQCWAWMRQHLQLN
ncbi:hypothetical protein SUGI_0034180 [Cryptomeria japonica]|nr:hypothetical protein SUGI_0034180 [Cryptomeria japonica]